MPLSSPSTPAASFTPPAHPRHHRLRRGRHLRLPWVLLLAGLIALSTQILPAVAALGN